MVLVGERGLAQTVVLLANMLNAANLHCYDHSEHNTGGAKAEAELEFPLKSLAPMALG